MLRKEKLLFLLYCILIAYLLINTGIVSDDFDAMARAKGKKLKDILIYNSYFINTPVEHFTHYIWYPFFSLKNQVILNILKISYIILSFYFVTSFFRIYLSEFNAPLASFLFIFYPSHDSTVYFFMCQYITLSFSFYLYSFYLAYKNKLTAAFLFAILGSFICYGSTPIAIGLFILFILNNELKKGWVIIIPNIIYIIYFISQNFFMHIGAPRIIEKISFSSVFKQGLLQILTFADSMFGASFWLKIYYSFSQTSFISALIFIIVAGMLILFRQGKKDRNNYNFKLAISFSTILLLSFVMFALTGRYPQLTFGLGNRVTIYGSLPLAYLIVLLQSRKKIFILFSLLIFFSILAISSHWKDWNIQQAKVIGNIGSNRLLNSYFSDATIYVSGNQYSLYGPFSHIEFLSESWVVKSIFKLALKSNISVAPLNKRHRYVDGYLIDNKYNTKEPVRDYINVYDSENDTFYKLEKNKINNYIGSLPQDNRHWLQIFNIGPFKRIVLKLMPRLKYAF